jgi:hypothetical protein
MPVVAVDAAIDYLLALELESAQVFDGDPLTEEQVTSYVLVGHDGGETPGPSSSTTLSRAAFEQDTRDEAGVIFLAVVATTGVVEDDLSACRAATLVTLTELEAALRADSTLGGAVADSWVSSVDMFPDRNDEGAEVRRVVTLSYEALQDPA